MSEPDRQLVSRFYAEVINARRLDLLDELVADAFIEHGPTPITGRDALRAFLAALVEGLPDVELGVEDWIAQGDRVVARCRVSGTHGGELFGYAATGRPVSWSAIHIWRIMDGRLAERWVEANLHAILAQLEPD